MLIKKVFMLCLVLASFSGDIYGCNTHMTEHSLAQPPIKTRVIINPNSGTQDKKNIERSISQFLNPALFDFEIFYTSGPRHATELSKEASALGYGLVIAVGGDGTVNEIGKGLIGSDTALGIIPSGSGNGLAKHLKIPTNPKKAIQVINRFHRIAIDTIKINNDHFIGIAGIGFDAHIAKLFAKREKRGFWSYIKLVLKEYSCYPSQIFEVEIDGQTVKKKCLLMSFANSSQYGNDIKIAPHADLCDGYLNLIVLKRPLFYALPNLLRRLKNGNIASSKYYESICCKQLRIRTDKLLAHVDGEPVFFEKGLLLEVLPKTLNVCAP